jgi:hypothetical protein
MPGAGPALANTFTGKLYRYHGMCVLDAADREVGIVDWVWSDAPMSHGEFIGVQLQWLRGKARAIPTEGSTVDVETRTVRVPYVKDQIRRAARYAIDRQLSADARRDIWAQYTGAPVRAPDKVAPTAVAA